MPTKRRWRPVTTIGGFFGHAITFVIVSLLGGVLLAGLVLPFAAGVGIAARNSADSFQDIEVPDLTIGPLPGRSVMQAADGSGIATFYQQNRQVVSLDKIAPIMQQALISIEDRRFYEHGPVDLRGVMRAFVENFKAGGVEEGASTLTMQYARNLLIQHGTAEERAAATEKTAERKLEEIKYAIALEDTYSKDDILLGYLNTVYFGNRSYGIEIAARNYFSVPAADLNLPQAALLAGLVQSPVAYDPTRNIDIATDRRNTVLDSMVVSGAITTEEAAAAKATPVELHVPVSRNGCVSSSTPFFCDYVYRWLLQRPELGPNAAARDSLLQSGALTIKTTMSPVAQNAAQAAISARIEPTNPVAGAEAMVEPGTGKVLAIATSRGFGEGEGKTTIDYAVDEAYGQSHGFQAGSTFKIFTLTAAMEKGVSLFDRFPGSTSSFPDFKNCTTGASFAPYIVGNSSSHGGNPTVLEATAASINTAFVGLEEQITQCSAADMATRMGAGRADGNPMNLVPSWTLGTDEVSPLTMASSVATLAARGNHCEPYPVLSVTDSSGKVLLAPEPACQQVMDPKWADSASYALQSVLQPGGTGAGSALDRPSAGKTGTTDDNIAVWFVGFTPNLAAAVYVGNPDSNLYPLENITVGGHYYSTIFGGTLPAPIWHDSMAATLADMPVIQFQPPAEENMIGREVDVPDVRGRSVDDAIDILEGADFRVTVASQRVPSDDYPKNTVADTDPGPGSSVQPRSTITIFVSSGPAPTPPPTTPAATPPPGR